MALAPVLAAQKAPVEGANARKFYEELISAPLVPLRDKADIQESLKATEKRLEQADKSIPQMQARIKEADGWLVTQKSEVDGLKNLANVAKNEKREADKLALEGQIKQLDLVENYLRRMRDIRYSELNVAKAQKDLVSAEVEVYRAEAEAQNKIDSIRTAGADNPNLSKIVLEGTQAGEKLLNRMKAMAEKNQDVAGQSKQLAERRLDLAEARSKLVTEDRIRAAAAGLSKKK